MKARTKYLLAKPEVTYGVNPTLAAANAIITTGLERQIYAGPLIERDNDRPTLGARQNANAASMASISFSCEMMGSGTLGTPPNYGPILRACGFDETISAGVSVEYLPVSSSYESVACGYNRSGELQNTLGMRGTGGLSIVAGQFPKFNFNLQGQYLRPTASAMVTPLPTPNIRPIPVNRQNTPYCTIGGVNLMMQSCEIDFGNSVTHLNMVSLSEIMITDRAVSGTLVVLAPAIATLDLAALAESHATVVTSAFALSHGTTPSIIRLNAPAMQITGISEVSIEGEQGYSLTFVLLPVAGDDELKISFL
jgi:hypothetical protein